MTARRLVVIAVLAAGLAAGLWYDREPVGGGPAGFGSAGLPLMPVAPAATALSSTWYCPGVPAPADGSQSGSIAIVNAGSIDLRGNVTFVPQGLTPVSQPVDVGAGERREVIPADVVDAPQVAALVEIIGGSVVVEQTAVVGGTPITMPCSSFASDAWYLADGDTRLTDAEQADVNARLVLLVFNPFADDAVVDFSFSTAEGFVVRQNLQGFVVPGRSLAVVDLNEEVRRTNAIAMEAITRIGRVVIARVQSSDGVAGRGTTYALAAPRPAEAWWFPDGRKGDGIRQRLAVWNPSADLEAEVTVEVRLDDPEAVPVEPFRLTVPARGTASLDLTAEETVPAGQFSIDVTTDLGVPVVVERITIFDDPADRRGVSMGPGAPVQADRWVLADPVGTGVGLDEVRVVNPTGEAVSVGFRSIVPGGAGLPVAGAESIAIGPGGAVTVRLDDRTAARDLPLEVEATGPVVVERVRVGGGAGVAQSFGVPLP